MSSHPHRGGHCDCDDHDGHRRACEDPDCPGCLAEACGCDAPGWILDEARP